MNSVTLQNLVRHGILPDDPALLALLEACDRPNACLAITYPLKGGICYVSPAGAHIYGYDANTLVAGGNAKLEAITTKESMPGVMQALFEFLSESKRPGFTPTDVLIKEFPFDIIRPDGTTASVVSVALGLTYAANLDLEYAVCLVVHPLSGEIEWARNMLTTIKKQHNKVHRHKPAGFQQEPLTKLNLLRKEPENVTDREKLILKHLANGLTSSEIAQAVGISENTVETHRKNLLAKFEAKNMAELIKIASKMYWLA